MTEHERVTLKDPTSALTATFIPLAGMVGSSLAEGGNEFLGQRRGLDAYVTNGKTMGIPILYPWANRLAASNYGIDGAVVTLTPGTGGVRADEHGVPIHGVLAAYPGWLVTARSENTLTAVLDFGGKPQLLASFPFPHVLTQSVTLKDRRLTIETTVLPTTSASVPLCFGYHPYLTIPGVPRAEWTLTTPAMRRLPVDDIGIPTGEHEDWNQTTRATGVDGVRRRLRLRARGCGVLARRRRPPHRRHIREGLSRRSDIRAHQRRRRVLRTDGRTDQFTVPRRLPLCGARSA